MSTREAEGQTVDAKDIRKHGNDAFRLSQLLAPESRIPVSAHIGEDLRRFLDAIASDASYDPRVIKINLEAIEIIDRIKRAYELEVTAGEGIEIK